MMQLLELLGVNSFIESGVQEKHRFRVEDSLREERFFCNGAFGAFVLLSNAST
jgi:hypothetical protein